MRAYGRDEPDDALGVDDCHVLSKPGVGPLVDGYHIPALGDRYAHGACATVRVSVAKRRGVSKQGVGKGVERGPESLNLVSELEVLPHKRLVSLGKAEIASDRACGPKDRPRDDIGGGEIGRPVVVIAPEHEDCGQRLEDEEDDDRGVPDYEFKKVVH